jgi:hypothetical protein
MASMIRYHYGKYAAARASEAACLKTDEEIAATDR